MAFHPINLSARDPIIRHGLPRFQVGLAAYSLRKQFRFMKGKPQTPSSDGPAIDMVGFLDYCVASQVDAAELTSYFFSPDPSDEYFLNLKREAYLRGVTISGTAIGNNFTVGRGPKLEAEIQDAIAWIDRSAKLGAPTFAFSPVPGHNLLLHLSVSRKHPKRSTDVPIMPPNLAFFSVSKIMAICRATKCST